jgi:hypothetical protein
MGLLLVHRHWTYSPTVDTVWRRGHAMNKYIKKFLIILVSLGALLFVAFILMPDVRTFTILQVSDMLRAGTWEDDPKNWYRAFNEEQPAEIKVVHSKYWKSNHFTDEFIYFFEVQAMPKWKEAFLRKRNFELVSTSSARSFRTNNHSDITPDWFAPDPVDKYDVWDTAGSFGSVWINKTNGHMFFYDVQL